MSHGIGLDGYSSETNAPGIDGFSGYPNPKTQENFVKRAPKNDYFGSGSDGFMYDFVKRAPKNDYFGSGSDGFTYDFVKRTPKNM